MLLFCQFLRDMNKSARFSTHIGLIRMKDVPWPRCGEGEQSGACAYLHDLNDF